MHRDNIELICIDREILYAWKTRAIWEEAGLYQHFEYDCKKSNKLTNLQIKKKNSIMNRIQIRMY